ncbi:MAG: FAD-dependent oxidoreductase, partial [Alphaproteobacteria bacterium]|nr:FAD-dependent oxidoreductase [Alphaproteobacteria bacterium]
ILGSGPAGLTAAIYCARANKKTLIVAGDTLGGQTAEIANLENYPAFSGSGMDWIQATLKQATGFGAEIVYASATEIKQNTSDYSVICDNNKTFNASAVIMATGARARRLEIDGAKELVGNGVSYCATCDGFFYSGKKVLVIGGGNSALNDALYLADLASEVDIIYRKPSFTRAEAIIRDRVAARENIKPIFNTELKSIRKKDDSTTGELIATTTNGDEIVCDGIFVAIGHEANTDYLDESIKRDDVGRIDSNNLPRGLFVAGDEKSGIKMQVATAVGTGCSAAMDAIAYVNTKGN